MKKRKSQSETIIEHFPNLESREFKDLVFDEKDQAKEKVNFRDLKYDIV
jgi:hypothetical protein